MPISYELAAKEYENVQTNLERAQLLSAFLSEALCREGREEGLAFSSVGQEGFQFLLAEIATSTAEAACDLVDLKPSSPQRAVPAEEKFNAALQ